MKIENFNLIERRGKKLFDFEYIAEVDVTTGLIFKKTERKKIYRDYSGCWCFVDTGVYAPELLVERAERAFIAQYDSLSEVDIIK